MYTMLSLDLVQSVNFFIQKLIEWRECNLYSYHLGLGVLRLQILNSFMQMQTHFNLSTIIPGLEEQEHCYDLHLTQS